MKLSSFSGPSREADVREPLVSLDGLSIGFDGASPADAAVRGVSFALRRGEVAALVGESGSGKTLLARALLGLLPHGARIIEGDALVLGRRLSRMTAEAHRRLRGPGIGIVLQEPLTSLNPALTIEQQLGEAQRLHLARSRADAREASIAVLERVGIEDAARRLSRYPHEFSGGMRQRIMIAAAALLRPQVLIADEPTTAVDSQAQRAVMTLLRELVEDLHAGLLLITHDLGVVADHADRVHVMKFGEIVESGAAEETLAAPRHEYTRGLLEALPRAGQARPPRGSREPPRLVTRDLAVTFAGRSLTPWTKPALSRALCPTSLELAVGEVLAIVGESGSGKTTLARAISGLTTYQSGTIAFPGSAGGRGGPGSPRLQMIFQDPYSSLNPRWRVAAIVAEPLRHAGVRGAELRGRVLTTLEECGLDAAYADRFPHQLSGGQRQRVGIARALVCGPDIVIADEPVSALDLTVQSRILALLRSLQEARGFSMIFISHDLSVVEAIADRIVVMRAGRVVEEGTCSRVFRHATHPYTQALLDASPVLSVQRDGTFRLGRRRYDALPLPTGAEPVSPDRNDSSEGMKLIELEGAHRVLARVHGAANA